jgi:hypothetical protein
MLLRVTQRGRRLTGSESDVVCMSNGLPPPSPDGQLYGLFAAYNVAFKACCVQNMRKRGGA